MPPEAPVLTLQNGLGNVETLCSAVGSARVLAGATSEAATLLGEGRVRHVAAGKTSFGAWTSCDPSRALDALRAAGFDAEITDAPGQLIWEKVSINAGINPLGAIMNVPNGRLVEISEIRQLMRDLVVEAACARSRHARGNEIHLFLLWSIREFICNDPNADLRKMLPRKGSVRSERYSEAEFSAGFAANLERSTGFPDESLILTFSSTTARAFVRATSDIRAEI